ncbi:P-loop containing nucleoside triphosphate hydrolase protein, partial [Coemansia spiralis]
LARRTPPSIESMLEVRVAVAGNVDAGKSTMLGVLTQGHLDDGRGRMRLALFRHKHEIDTGRTSSIGMEILGFDNRGQAVRHTDTHRSMRKLDWHTVCTQSSKLVAFLDLAGHEKYLKTTMFGMAGGAPDYIMLMVAANAGLTGMAKEHLGLALALNVPVFVVITKIDMCPPMVLDATLKQLTKVLRSSGCRKLPLIVNDRAAVVMAAQRFTNRVCPVFQVSNVTGENVDNLLMFLNILPIAHRPKAIGPLRFDINEIFSVPFAGTVVSGVVTRGEVRVNDLVWVGPDFHGNFQQTTIKGIQRKRVDVESAVAGQSVSMALKKIARSQVRKGMVVFDKGIEPVASRTFEAEVVILYHSTTITQRYQAMVHCGCVRQTARILSITRRMLRTGDRALVVFQFIRHPECLAIDTRLIFREGRTKGVGKV